MCTYQLRSQSRLLRSRRSQCGPNITDQEWDAHGSSGFTNDGDDLSFVTDALTDPLYQLLVQHVLFCRLAEEVLAHANGAAALSAKTSTHAANHRSKRRPAS